MINDKWDCPVSKEEIESWYMLPATKRLIEVLDYKIKESSVLQNNLSLDDNLTKNYLLTRGHIEVLQGIKAFIKTPTDWG